MAPGNGDELHQLHLRCGCRQAGPGLAAFFVLKAALDAAQGSSPLGSVVAAIFLLTFQARALLQGFNSGGTLATVDMLASLWNYLAGTILPEAAGLAVVGAVINYPEEGHSCHSCFRPGVS